MTEHRNTLTALGRYVAPEAAYFALRMESLLLQSDSETIEEDETEYGWDNN